MSLRVASLAPRHVVPVALDVTLGVIDVAVHLGAPRARVKVRADVAADCAAHLGAEVTTRDASGPAAHLLSPCLTFSKLALPERLLECCGLVSQNVCTYGNLSCPPNPIRRLGATSHVLLRWMSAWAKAQFPNMSFSCTDNRDHVGGGAEDLAATAKDDAEAATVGAA